VLANPSLLILKLFSRFIHPLTPVTRKYLEVQKFANLTGGVEPLALTLSAPTAKPNPPRATQALEQSTHRPPPSNGHAPTRRDNYASYGVPSAMNPPPRPHSSASTARPRHVPAASTSSGNSISNARPLSAHVVGYVETERPRSMLGEWSQRLELQRQQSRDNASNHTEDIAFPSSFQPTQREPDTSTSHGGKSAGDRQRSVSVTNGQNDVNRALGIMQGLKDSKERQERRDNGHDHPPRPPSVTSDRPPFMRPKSVLSMRSNGAPSRPISATSDTIEQSYAHGPPTHPQDIRPKSPLGPSKPANGYERPQISQYGQTPRTAVERPAVVYLPSTEFEVPAPPRPQKTWSLSYQIELLNKRKKPEGPKLEDANIVSPVDFTASSEIPVVADAQGAQPEISKPVEPTETIVAVHAQSVSTPDQTEHNQGVITADERVVFPTQTTQEDKAVVLSPKVSTTQIPATSADLPLVPTEDARSRTMSSSSKGVAATVKPVAAVTSVHPRVRTISASKMPVRPPSRSTHTQATGFVPKRTLKSSVTQPTKSQAARAQAVMSEKSVKVGSGVAESTSVKSSQVSTKRNEGTTKESATCGFKPTRKIPPVNPNLGANTRTREGPRKPPVPTVSSLIKTHAARREAGLATVAVKLGAAPNSLARVTTAPRPKSQAVVSSKKTIRSVDANNSRNLSTEPAQGSRIATTKEESVKASIPVPGAPLALGQTETVGRVDPQEQATSAKAEKKANASVLDATLPLPSSSFAIGDEMVGITFKQPGETCAVPVICGNQGGARLLKELHVS
jgi:hypothetical protein